MITARNRVLHICHLEKFIPPFIDFVEEYFDDFATRHLFFINGDTEQYPYKARRNIVPAGRGKKNQLLHLAALAHACNKADKIIIHGLCRLHVVMLLAAMPWVLPKAYWIMWGGDLYVYQLDERNWRWKIKEFFRRPVIKNMGYLVTGTPGDVDFAREWYGAKGHHIRCFNYPSNIYKHREIQPKVHETINIQVGNSADPTNQHLEIFDQLDRLKDKDFKIYSVLSYGNSDYMRHIMAEGERRFGEKFIAITDMMPFDQYLDFLASIDIAIFNHKRQQAFGNIITLLGFGKKVYINPASTLNEVFSGYGLKVFNSQNIDLSQLDDMVKNNNIKIVRCSFSKESLVRSLNEYIA